MIPIPSRYLLGSQRNALKSSRRAPEVARVVGRRTNIKEILEGSIRSDEAHIPNTDSFYFVCFWVVALRFWNP
jgi:hypothetical protein